MASLHVQEHPGDLKSIRGKGVTSELDIDDAGLKEMFPSSTTPVVSIQECRARDFCEHGDRNIVMGHWENCLDIEGIGTPGRDEERCSTSAWRDQEIVSIV